MAAAIEAHDPSLQIIALGHGQYQTVPIELVNAGAREYLELPLKPLAVSEAVERRSMFLNRIPNYLQRTLGTFYSFLPAKAGVGASLLAANVSSLVSSEHAKSTLLTDFDAGSGTVAFRYRLEQPHSVSEALARAEQLDDEMWSSLVVRHKQLDILPSDLKQVVDIQSSRLIALLDYIRSKYQIGVFDLSGNLEPHTFDLMHDSQILYLVCTQELDCLHLARGKADILRKLNLDDRVRVLVNRFRKDHPLSQSHIEDLLELKVEMVFPNDYKSAEASIVSGTSLDPLSPLGNSLRLFASELVGKPRPLPTKGRRFIDFFSLPARLYLNLNRA